MGGVPSLSALSCLVRRALFILVYITWIISKSRVGSCGGFEIIQRKLCKSKMIRRGKVSRAKVDKGGTGEVT